LSKTKSLTASALFDAIEKFFRESDKGKYVEKIDQYTGQNFTIMFYDVFDYDQQLFNILLNEPKVFVEGAKKAIENIYKEKFGEEKAKALDIYLIVDKSENKISIDDCIKHKHRNKLVETEGMINGETDIETRIVEGAWLCPDGHITKIKGDYKPLNCDIKECSWKQFELDQEATKTESYRRFYIIDNFHNGRMDTLVAEGKDCFTNSMGVTDKSSFTGYISIEKHRDKVYNLFNVLNSKKLKQVSYNLTEDEKKIFQEWPNQDGFFDKLIKSVAPRISGNKLVKIAFIFSYVNAPQWDESQKHWINVLVVGDPAQAKTLITMWGNKHLPYCETATVGSTAKGLFAGLKEQPDGKKVLEIGAMVRLHNKGQLCIDEFLLMPDVFSIFKYPMDSGKFPSNTVGGKAELDCATSIYATGNPYNKGFWNEYKSIQENLHVMDYATLSRFDLIIVVKSGDKTREEQEAIAKKILGITKEDEELYHEESVAKYLIYAKSVNPVLNDDVKTQIVKTVGDIFKEKIKQQSESENLDVGEINERLTGIVTRLTLAFSRLYLRKEAEIQDVIFARNLLKEMYDQRGFKIGIGQTYIEIVGQLIFDVLEKNSARTFTDKELENELIETYAGDTDEFNKVVGENGCDRVKNKKWRKVMQYVEHSDLVEIVKQKHPHEIRWRVKGQTRFQK